jgi:tetratricopeptide (TPR) repeat protein
MNMTKAPKPRRKQVQGIEEIPVIAYLASRYLKYGALDNARALYSLLVSLKPRKLNYRAALGYACFKSGRAEEALAHLETAFKGRKDLSGWETMLLGRTLKANGMNEESQTLVRRFLEPGLLESRLPDQRLQQPEDIR